MSALQLGPGRQLLFSGVIAWPPQVTDLYINWMHLFPNWRQLMWVDPDFVQIVLRATTNSLETSAAAGRATVLVVFLLVATFVSIGTSRQLAWWAFGGAVFSTLIVDGLFFFNSCSGLTFLKFC